MKVRVVRRHDIPGRAPLVLVAGDEVEVGASSEEWPAFVFVSCTKGEGWVPARHLTSERPVALAIVGYDTTELAVNAGELVTLVERDDESAWWWCEDDSGSRGWISIEALDVESH